MNETILWDIAAGIWLLICWCGYTYFARHKARKAKCLLTATRYYEYRWMLQITEREVRIADATAISILERTVSFFAATTLLILGGLLGFLLNRTEETLRVLSKVPFFVWPEEGVWEAKTLFLICAFIYAFFKFTWSLRQLGFTIMMIGGSPFPKAPEEQRKYYAAHVARVFYLGMNAFNYGLRAYYFSLGALAWFVNPLFVAVSTIWVVVVLYKREFYSKALDGMEHDLEPLPWPVSKDMPETQ